MKFTPGAKFTQVKNPWYKRSKMYMAVEEIIKACFCLDNIKISMLF